METKEDHVLISDNIGSVSTLTMVPEDAIVLMVLGHGAGAGMRHKFMQGLSESLFEEGIGTVRFQFPYMEQGRKRPDFPAVAHLCIEKILEHVEPTSSLPLILSGKSFGGRMASQLMAKKQLDAVRALVFYGFPLHSPAKPGNERAEHLKEVSVPMLFIQGDRDNLARLDLLEPVLDHLPLATLEVCEGANHGFSFLKKTGITESDMYKLLADITSRYLKTTGII